MKKPNSKLRCLAIGSAMVDVIATIADRDVERMTLHNATLSFLLVEQGRKIEAQRISSSIGGGGVNVAVAFRRLGHEADILARLGDDAGAAQVRGHLEAEGIGAELVKTSPQLPTGSAVLIASHDKDAAIYTQRGANTSVTAGDIRAVDFQRYGLVHVAPLSGSSADCLQAAVVAGAGAGAFVVVNPGIRQITTRAADILKVVSRVALLAMNAREAAAFAPALAAFAGSSAADRKRGVDGSAAGALLREGLRLNDSTFPLSWFFATLAATGAQRVLVTNGADGSYLFSNGTLFHCPVVRAQVMGTAGAGDAFCATLGEGLATGLPEAAALIRAAANAASVVGFADSQSGLLDIKKLDAAAANAGIAVWNGKI